MSDIMETSSLSHPRAVTIIKDPIHEAITLTCFEREIVDSEHFQRLHFILQNSTTYVAYPANKNSRFVHSLGVCHLSGALFTNSLRNSTIQDLDDFLENAAKLLAETVKGRPNAAKDIRAAWKETISGHSSFRHRPSLRTKGTREPVESRDLQTLYPINYDVKLRDRKFSAGLLVDTLWQAVRLCGLVHDIGHLPMSHSLEGALEKFQKRLPNVLTRLGLETECSEDFCSQFFLEISCEEQYQAVFDEFDGILQLAYPNDVDLVRLRESFSSFPVHEKRSLFILYELFHRGIYEFKGIAAEYRSLIYNIAFLILFSSIKSDQEKGDSPRSTDTNLSQTLLNNSAFRFLKLIVAGSVDGDRMDYTLRDGLSCGSQIGRYDMEDIVESATLFRNKSNLDFRLGFFYRSLPAIEQFFNQRHQGYKYLIYHRTSARTETCLQYAMAALIEFCYLHPDDEISSFFQNLGYMHKSPDLKHRVFPIYLDTELDEDAGSLKSSQVPMLDDANLRGFLEWTLRRIEARIKKEPEAKAEKLEKIRVLLRIFLKREFQHIFDPFKDRSMTSQAKKAFKIALGKCSKSKMEKEFKKAAKLIMSSTRLREQIVNTFGENVCSFLEADVQFLSSEQKPKVYNHENAAVKGEEVYLVYNDVSGEGFVPVKPIIDTSPTLRDMGDIYFKEFRINCYFVGNNIKKNGVCELIQQQIDDALLDAARVTINGMYAT